MSTTYSIGHIVWRSLHSELRNHEPVESALERLYEGAGTADDVRLLAPLAERAGWRWAEMFPDVMSPPAQATALAEAIRATPSGDAVECATDLANAACVLRGHVDAGEVEHARRCLVAIRDAADALLGELGRAPIDSDTTGQEGDNHGN